PGYFFPVFKYRSVKHGAGERFAARCPRDSICGKHFCHPRVWRCAGVLVTRLHRWTHEHACGVFVCISNYLHVGCYMAFWREIPSSRYSRRRKQNGLNIVLSGTKNHAATTLPGSFVVNVCRNSDEIWLILRSFRWTRGFATSRTLAR